MYKKEKFEKEQRIITIQSYIRKYKEKCLKDRFTKEMLKDMIIFYNSIYNFYDGINKTLTNKKIRYPNYPSENNDLKIIIYCQIIR